MGTNEKEERLNKMERSSDQDEDADVIDEWRRGSKYPEEESDEKM
jgi:hypothetical protein